MNTSKKIISLLMCMLMVLTMVPMSVFATEATEIDTVHVEGVLAPQYGDTVKDHFDDMIKKGDDGEFKVNGLGYYVCDLFDDMGFSLLDKDKKSLDKSEVIVEGIYYFAMEFLPSDGYVIPNDVAVTLDGALSVEKDFDEDGWLIAYAKFEVKATEIDTVNIEGVPAPLYGQTVKEYNTVMYNGSLDGIHKINGSTRVDNDGDIIYGNIELADWEYYNSEKSYLAPSSADALPSVYYLVHWLYPAAGYKFPDDVAVTVDGAVSVETELDEDGCLAVWAEFEVAPPTEIDTVHIECLPAPLYGQTSKDYLDDVIAKVKVNNELYDSTNQTYGNLNVEWQAIYDSTKTSLSSSEILTAGTYYYLLNLYPKTGFVFADIDDISASVNGNASVELEASTEYDDTVLVWVKFEVAPPTEITSVELTVSGYQCGGFANQITFTGSEGIYMIPSTYPVFTDINDFEGTALGKYDGFCRDTEYWVSAAFAAADGYTLPELSKDDITLKGFTVLDKYVSYDATEQIIWVAFKLSAHSFDNDSDNTCNLCNKERYTYTEADGKVTITAYNGPGGAVNIPSTIGGYPVTVIGEEAFCEKYDITSVSIPDSVTTIEEEAFYDNELTSVHIGKGVTSIGEDAFAFSPEFETITVDEDNDYYLSENNVLFDIDKEELIVYAVKKTDTSYTVPATVNKIHRAAFNFAENLKSITISDGVTDIGSFAFSGCENITSLIIPNSVTSIGSYAFSQMDNLKYVIISDKLTTVSSYAFQYCSKLTDVVIPASVTSIESGAFRYCPSLSDIYYTGTQAQWENVAVNNYSGYHDKFLSANVHYNAQVVDGHVYDNDCDAECNLCTEIRTAPHTYDNDCDAECNLCTEIRTAPHAYDNACDAECNNCPATRTPAAHTGGTATCTEKAKCSVCGEAYGSINKDNHKSLTTLKAVASTCTKTGTTEGKKCTACGEITVAQKTVAKKAHTYKNVTTKATLTKNGKVESKCSVCGNVSKTTTVYYPKTIKLSKTEYTYNGKVQTPSVTVKDSKGNTLKKDTDYTVKYESGRKAAGKYTVTITFKGKYTGTKTLTYTIVPKVTSKITATQTTTTITLKWNKVTGADGYRVYKYNSKTKKYEKLKDVTKNTLKIEKLKAGTAYKYKVKAYTKDDGTIWGDSSKVFETATKCKTPKITKLTTTKGKATFVWSNVSGESGYQVYYSTKKDSGYKKVKSYKVNVVKGSKTKLKSGKNYYFKVRAYKKTASGTVYSSWSAVKSVKIK